MRFGLQWQLSFPGKHAFGHRHYTAHTPHICIIFRQIFREKNTSLLWQGNRHYTAHTLASQTKLFIPQEPNVESCVSCGCLKIRKNHPKCLLIDSRNPMFFFFFWDPIETRLLCVSLYPNPMAVGLQVQGLQLQWTSQPLEVKQLRFLLPKTLG